MADATQYFNAISYFQDARARLNALEALMRSNSAVAAAIGADVTAAEARYQQIRSIFTDMYRAAFGTVPAGLAALPALGAVVTVGLVIAALVALIAFLVVLNNRAQQYLAVQQTEASTALTAQQTAASLESQAQIAEAAGNPALAAQLRGQVSVVLSGTQGALGTLSQIGPYALLIGGGLALYLVLRG